MRILMTVTLLLMTAMLPGCGSGRFPGAKVTGTVTVDGKPLPVGSVLMESADGKFNDSGAIGANGEFAVDNAPLGKVKVCLLLPAAASMDEPKPAKAPPDAKKAPADEHITKLPKDSVALLSKVPAKYKDMKSSDLTFEVQAKQNEPFVIAIKTQ